MSNTNHESNEVAALVERLEVKRKRLTEQLAENTRQLEAAKLTLSLIRRKGAPEAEEIPIVSSKEIQNMSQLDAMIYMAKRGNNKIKIVAARDALRRAGKMSGKPKNHYNIITTIAKRSGLFQNCGRGEYELLEGDKSVLQIRRATA